MEVIVHSKPESNRETLIQLLPCKVNYNGEAEVDKYFTVNLKQENEVFTNSLRGRPLKGQDIKLENCTGIVFETEVKGEKMELNPIGLFEKIRYWNWGNEPSKNDLFVKALDYFDIAEALAKPITE